MHKSRWVAATGGLLLAISVHANCLTEPLEALEADAQTPLGGHAALCMEGGLLQATLRAQGLLWKEVYSAWWVYFDDPSACLEPHACGPRDLAEPYEDGKLPAGIIGRMASGLAFPSGELVLSGELRRFVLAEESELWLLLMSHGSANRVNPSQLARQLLTPEMPVLGAPLAGRDEDGWRGSWWGVSIFDARDLLTEGGAP